MERFISGLPNRQEINPIEKRWIIGEAAASLEEQWRVQRSLGNANTFLEELTATIIRNGPKLSPAFTSPNISIDNRRQPSFIEAVAETSKRLQTLERLVNTAPESVRGIVVGGSVSYGKFYCVRGAPDPSDIDLFYIVDPAFFTREQTSNAFNSKAGIDAIQAERFYERAARFPELMHSQKAALMSEKFKVEDFIVSVKILPLSTFRAEFDTDLKLAANKNGNQIQPVLDYKHELYPITSFTQYNFLGEPYTFLVNQNLQADGSSIANIPSIIVASGHLYTGDHHNHAFPKYEIMLDRNGDIGQIIQTFEERLRQRAKQERKYFRREDINVLRAHDRKNVFSPQVLEEAMRKFQ
ncbi:MAG: hypothetical protein HY425_02685 [Candidatus Levybacteria bacterium]|nr:hypothetical protein [Candidatus Levybacteria bacterium]